jgi:hypothetical protein
VIYAGNGFPLFQLKKNTNLIVSSAIEFSNCMDFYQFFISLGKCLQVYSLKILDFAETFEKMKR